MKRITDTTFIINALCILFILMVVLTLCSGCASIDSRVAKIPQLEFKKFVYNRTGNVTSAHISASNSKIEGDYFTIEDLTISENFGPAVSFNIVLEGYKIRIEDGVMDEN